VDAGHTEFSSGTRYVGGAYEANAARTVFSEQTHHAFVDFVPVAHGERF
jgi:hypothetical protein